jgi:hypothetical protein
MSALRGLAPNSRAGKYSGRVPAGFSIRVIDPWPEIDEETQGIREVNLRSKRRAQEGAEMPFVRIAGVLSTSPAQARAAAP